MVKIDLEEIKKKTSTGLSIFYNYHNIFSWQEIKDNTPDGKYKDVPLFDLPKSAIKNGELSVVYDAGQRGGAYCFGDLTIRYRRKFRVGVSRLIVKITPLLKLTPGHTLNNHCWMDLDMLNYWIQTMKEEIGLDFFYRISEKENSRYEIAFDFRELSKIQMKYVLFWTRYTYEYPASFLALDAMILKQIYYPDETLQNLLTLVSQCQQSNSIRISFSQCITVNGNFITSEKLSERLGDKRRSTVSGIFGSFNHNDIVNYYDFYGKKERYITGASWLNVTKRFEYYQDSYSILKEHEIK